MSRGYRISNKSDCGSAGTIITGRSVVRLGSLRTGWPITAVVLAAQFLAAVHPSNALVGDARAASGSVGRHVVMIVSTRGNLCTGTVLERDLVLTAGHCVAPAATYRVLTPGMTPPGLAIRAIAVHPRYSPKDYASGRVTADVALLKLEQPLPSPFAPAALAGPTTVAPGDRFVVVGYGTTSYGGDSGIGVPRVAALVATGKPGTLQVRLFDPVTRDVKSGLGACTGDSGGPAFVESGGVFAVVGVVSWSTGAASTAGCGGLTGVTPLTIYRAWLVEQAKNMGSVVAP